MRILEGVMVDQRLGPLRLPRAELEAEEECREKDEEEAKEGKVAEEEEECE